MDILNFEDLDTYLRMQNGKIIHQIWFGTIPNKLAARKAFNGLRKYRDSWLICNPTWTYVCWNLDRCKKLIKHYYIHHQELYDGYPYQIQKCDAIRYFILHRYGGLYADMDYYCNKPWDQVLQEFANDIYLVETPNKIGDDIHVSNSLMFSRPGHPFWSKLFIELEQHKTAPIYYGRHMTIMFTTGPGILNRVYNKYRVRYKLGHYPHSLFHPYGVTSDLVSLNSSRKVYATHVGKGPWESNDSKFIIFIYQEYVVLLFITIMLAAPYLVYNTLKSRSKKTNV